MKQVIQGILIGIGKIIPGVSGSLIAISLGVYETAIDCITNLFKDLKNNLKYLGLLGIGIIMSISFFSKIIIFFLDNYYIYTMFLFIGLILGSQPKTSNNKKHYYISLISFSMVLGFSLISRGTNLVIYNKILSFLYFIFIGIVDAFTMIVPGVSGTATLMMLGAYEIIVDVYSNIFNLSLILHNLAILIPLGIGIIIGIYLSAKLINYLFKNYKDQTYQAIRGFLYGTVVYMLILCLKNYQTSLQLIISLAFAVIGYFSIKKINQLL